MSHLKKLEKLTGVERRKMCVFKSIFIDFRKISEKLAVFTADLGSEPCDFLGNV